MFYIFLHLSSFLLLFWPVCPHCEKATPDSTAVINKNSWTAEWLQILLFVPEQPGQPCSDCVTHSMALFIGQQYGPFSCTAVRTKLTRSHCSYNDFYKAGVIICPKFNIGWVLCLDGTWRKTTTNSCDWLPNTPSSSWDTQAQSQCAPVKESRINNAVKTL